MSGPRIEILKALKDNFIYILVHNGQCAVVDPGEAQVVEQFLAQNNLKLTHILCTHHHWDHTDGVAELVKNHGCEVWCSEPDFTRIRGASKIAQGSMQLWNEPVEVMNVPGHTIGQIAFYFPRIAAVFPGDTLFSAGCGRLFEGTAEQMYSSLQKFKQLPSSTRIFFGHEYTLRNLDFVEHYKGASPEAISSYRAHCKNLLSQGIPTTPSTLKIEMEINPFLMSADVKEFAKWRELRNDW